MPRRVAKFGLALLAIAFARWCLINVHVESDTLNVQQGLGLAWRCIAGQAPLPCAGVQHFPIFQYLTLALTRLIGFSDRLQLRMLGHLSTLAFFAVLYVGHQTLGRSRALWAFAFLASPLLWYASSTFNEMMAAALALGLVIALEIEHAPAVLGFALLTTLTKEIAPILILILAGFMWRVSPARLPRKVWLSLGLGTLLGIAINSGWNLFRFGSVANTTNLQPLFHVPTYGESLRIALGLWFSPSSGLLFQWPTLVLALAWFFAHAKGRERGVLALFLITLTAGLSRWYAPFGWVAWGPRLMLPWLPALLWLALKRAPAPKIREPLECGLLAVCAVLAIPQILMIFSASPLDTLFRGDAVCPTSPAIQDSINYYACLNHTMFERTIPLSEWGALLRRLGPALSTLCYLATLGGLLFFSTDPIATRPYSSDKA